MLLIIARKQGEVQWSTLNRLQLESNPERIYRLITFWSGILTDHEVRLAATTCANHQMRFVALPQVKVWGCTTNQQENGGEYDVDRCLV